MNVLVLEWIEKADGDFGMAGRELRSRSKPYYDGVCFHAQQRAEKYLKAYLQFHDQEIPKIHHLLELVNLCQPIDATVGLLITDLRLLDRFAVSVRYPGASTDKTDAKNAYQTAARVRQFIRQRLELPN